MANPSESVGKTKASATRYSRVARSRVTRPRNSTFAGAVATACGVMPNGPATTNRIARSASSRARLDQILNTFPEDHVAEPEDHERAPGGGSRDRLDPSGFVRQGHDVELFSGHALADQRVGRPLGVDHHALAASHSAARRSKYASGGSGGGKSSQPGHLAASSRHQVVLDARRVDLIDERNRPGFDDEPQALQAAGVVGEKRVRSRLQFVAT